MPTMGERIEHILRPFLETDPLYRAVRIPSGFTSSDIWPKKIEFWCSIDGADKTFHTQYGTEKVEMGFNHLRYKCGDCEEEVVYFLVRGFLRGGEASEGFVEKVGQYPPWRIEPSKSIRKFLGEAGGEFYKKALVSLSQGYGLGALAYFRRVVEDSARDLLLLLAKYHEHQGADDDEVQEIRTLAEGKKTEEMLKKAVEAFPEHLRPGNVNPMSAIYDAASEGLHQGSEEDCVNKAMQIRKSLEYVIPQVSRQIEASEGYIAAMRELND